VLSIAITDAYRGYSNIIAGPAKEWRALIKVQKRSIEIIGGMEISGREEEMKE
jgi:hypothetical protein